MSSLKPITLYGHSGGPNPWKVYIVLEELGLPFKYKILDMASLKKEPYVNINPNGRVPAIEDPNTGITLWESGAIISYLVDQYDKEGRISYREAPEKYLLQQWLMFQMSGQGPYFGQFSWFSFFHAEKIPSAISRYSSEIERVIGVLDRGLTGKDWLVGDKCTFADLAFVTWHAVVPLALKEVNWEEKYPNYAKWMGKMLERESVVKTLAEKKKAQEAEGKH